MILLLRELAGWILSKAMLWVVLFVVALAVLTVPHLLDEWVGAARGGPEKEA